MGRHTVPGTGTPEPDRGFWVRAAVAAVVVLVVGVAYLLTRGGGGDVGTSAEPGGRPTASPSSTTDSPSSSSTSSSSGSGSGSAPASPTSSATTRPATLTFTVRYPAYITVRVPGGRTLVSRTYPSGATASFDQKVLQVVNGRPRAVRFVVNGRPRPQGPSGQVETFTVRRR